MNEVKKTFRVISHKPGTIGEQKSTIQDQPVQGSLSEPTVGFAPKSRSPRLDVQQQAEARQRNASAIREAITTATLNLSVGDHIGLPLELHTQALDNSCLLACSVAVAESVARIANSLQVYDESQLASLARDQGLLAGGGMTTERQGGRERVFDFLRSHLGITVAKEVALDVTSPEMLGLECVNAIQDKNVALLNYPLGTAGHWVAIFALTKQAQGDIRWSVMNPLHPSIENLSNDQLVERLLGTALTGAPEQRYGELLILDTASASGGFRPVSRSQS